MKPSFWKSRKEAAKYLGCDVKSIDKNVKEGRLKPRIFPHIGKRFSIDQLDNLGSGEMTLEERINAFIGKGGSR